MITKKEELAIINETIGKLGENSYLGPWLLSVRHELEAMMRADTFPRISLAEAKDHALHIVKEGEQKAGQIVAKAEKEAEKRETKAQSNVDFASSAIRGAIQSLIAIDERF